MAFLWLQLTGTQETSPTLLREDIQMAHSQNTKRHSLKVEGFGLKSKATQLPLPHTAQMKMVENANARECVWGGSPQRLWGHQG